MMLNKMIKSAPASSVLPLVAIVAVVAMIAGGESAVEPAAADHREVIEIATGSIEIDPKYGVIEINPKYGADTPGCETTADGCFTYYGGSEAYSWIIFHNSDTVAHTFTSGNPQDGPNHRFVSGLLMPGDEYGVSFGYEGTYEFYCEVHPWMLGSFTIVAPPTGPATGDTVNPVDCPPLHHCSFFHTSSTGPATGDTGDTGGPSDTSDPPDPPDTTDRPPTQTETETRPPTQTETESKRGSSCR